MNVTAVERIINMIQELPQDGKRDVANYLVRELEDQELKEDIALAIQEYQEWQRTGEASPAEDVFRRLEEK